MGAAAPRARKSRPRGACAVGGKIFRSRLRGRMGPQCRQRSKRLREGFQLGSYWVSTVQMRSRW